MNIRRAGLTGVTNRGNSSSYSFTHSGGSCNVALVTLIAWYPPASVDSVTYGGDSMSLLEAKTGGNNQQMQIWGLRGCKPGSQTVAISVSSNGANVWAGAVTYIGLHGSETFPNDSNSDQTSSTSLTVSVTTTIDDCVLFGFANHMGLEADALSVGAGTTSINTYNPGGGSDSMILESTPFKTGTAGSKSLAVSVTNNLQDINLAVIAMTNNLSNPNFFVKSVV